MNTKKISHIGVLVHDADAATKLWTEAFGFKKFEDRRIAVEGIRSVFISLGGTWDEMVIEIMEPLDKADMTNALSKRLASAGEDRRVILWDVEAARQLTTLEGHDKAAVSVAFSPDGRLLASAGDDGKLILWNWDLEYLAEQACRVANRNLSCNEWRQYVGGPTYRKTCSELPENCE